MCGRFSLSLLIIACILLLCSCGGGGSSPPPPPTPDFTLNVGPATLVATVGRSSSPAVVTIANLNGFNQPVNVGLSGVENGITSSPSSPLTISAGTSQEITFSIPADIPTGQKIIQFTATSGNISKSSSLILAINPEPVIRTYQSGAMQFLEADTGNEVARIGLLMDWGGSITEVSLNGVNYVNANDPGREVQAELWDGNNLDISKPGFWGNVQAGDHDFDGSPVLAQSMTSDTLYIKTRSLFWIPEYFGGSSGSPVPSDVSIEQWVTPVPGHGRAFKVHYKIVHLRSDTHANAGQEYPAVYINRGFDTFEYYGGTNPWTYDSLSTFIIPDLPMQSPFLVTPERWGAYMDQNGSGITVYSPGAYPWSHGFNAPGDSPNGTNYFIATTPFTWAPEAVLESNFYVIAGPISDARPIIYELRHHETNASPFSAMGNVEMPLPGDTLTGAKATVGGWAFASSPIIQITVFIDGLFIGPSQYGTSRPDIPKAFPGEVDPNVGYESSFDTTKLANGNHTLVVKAVDSNGNVTIFPTVPFVVSN